MSAFDDLIPSGGSFDDLIPKKKPADTELTWSERNIAPLLDKFSSAMDAIPDAINPLNALAKSTNGNMRGSAVGRVMQGMADPGVAIAQLGANAIGQGRDVNQGIANTEAQYQAARGQAGSSGFDPARLLGNVAITAPVGGLGGAAESAAGLIGKSALTGGAFGAAEPITNGGDSFWADKAKQAAMGAAVGGVSAPLLSGLGRLISPNASVNPQLKLLQDAGVQPTIGQAAGGFLNTVEEKLQSSPILGDAINYMKNRAKSQYNQGGINRTVSPIGEAVEGSGFPAIARAGDLLSNEYGSALSSIKGVNFDTPQFNTALDQLRSMSTNLVPDMEKKFNSTLDDIVLGRMSPNGSMLPEVYKKVDSELGNIERNYSGSSSASEKEYGAAIKQLQANLLNEVKASNPQVADRLNAADEGWANLVRVERAAKSAKNTSGEFSPAQLNQAVAGSDMSTRGRAVSRGEALMQDYANAGQQVLGNKYPDSGTPGRLLLNAGALATYALHPGIPAALLGAASVYAPPVQNALVALMTKRPDLAPRIKNYLRQMTPALAAPASQAFLQPGQR